MSSPCSQASIELKSRSILIIWGFISAGREPSIINQGLIGGIRIYLRQHEISIS